MERGFEIVIEKYVRMLKFAGMQPTTIKSYTNHLNSFLRYTGREEPLEEQLEVYLSRLSDREISESSWNQNMYAIKFYYEKILNLQFPDFIKRKRQRRTLKMIPEKNQILRSIYLNEDIREKTIMLIFYDGFLRRTELQKLQVKDIDFRLNVIIVHKGKGNKDRYVPVSQTTMNFIRYYLDTRTNQNNPYLFHRIGSDTRYISKKYLYDVVKDSGLSVEEDYWHPYLLRHAGATHSWLETGDLVSISDKLGHKDVQTTMIYLNLTERHLINKKTNPISPLTNVSYAHNN